MAADLHQHLWPTPFLEALRARRSGPRLDGWELHLPGERVHAAPDGIDRVAPLLDVLDEARAPLLVHPGPARGHDAPNRPAWWAPVVPYVAQLHAAWWAWANDGRARFPDIPVCFVALAGLGPLHGERYRA